MEPRYVKKTNEGFLIEGLYLIRHIKQIHILFIESGYAIASSWMTNGAFYVITISICERQKSEKEDHSIEEMTFRL